MEGNAAGHAFLFDSGEMTEIGTFGGSNSVAQAIDSSGTVVGYAHVRNDRTVIAFAYRDGRKARLGTLGGPFSAAYAINDKGEIVGDSLIDRTYTHAFLFRDGTMEDIGTLGGTYSAARDINRKGQVVGVSTIGDDSAARAFLYRNGRMRDIGDFNATSINDRSEVIGYALTPSGNHVFHYRAGKLRDLGTLAGADTYPISINNCGEVVGQGITGTGLHAFLHFKGEFLDLNSVMPRPLARHVVLESANAINDHGQIAAGGFDIEDRRVAQLSADAIHGGTLQPWPGCCDGQREMPVPDDGGDRVDSSGSHCGGSRGDGQGNVGRQVSE